jgi:hypothetical protein
VPVSYRADTSVLTGSGLAIELAVGKPAARLDRTLAPGLEHFAVPGVSGGHVDNVSVGMSQRLDEAAAALTALARARGPAPHAVDVTTRSASVLSRTHNALASCPRVTPSSSRFRECVTRL